MESKQEEKKVPVKPLIHNLGEQKPPVRTQQPAGAKPAISSGGAGPQRPQPQPNGVVKPVAPRPQLAGGVAQSRPASPQVRPVAAGARPPMPGARPVQPTSPKPIPRPAAPNLQAGKPNLVPTSRPITGGQSPQQTRPTEQPQSVGQKPLASPSNRPAPNGVAQPSGQRPQPQIQRPVAQRPQAGGARPNQASNSMAGSNLKTLAPASKPVQSDMPNKGQAEKEAGIVADKKEMQPQSARPHSLVMGEVGNNAQSIQDHQSIDSGKNIKHEIKDNQKLEKGPKPKKIKEKKTPKEKKPREKKSGVAWLISTIIILILAMPMIVIDLLFTIQIMTTPKGENPTLFGATPYICSSDTFAPEIKEGDLMLFKEVSLEDLQENDIILYYNTINHIVLKVEKISISGNEKTYFTKSEETGELIELKSDQISAKLSSNLGGVGSFIVFAQSTVGIIIFIGLPVLAYITFEIVSFALKRKNKKKQDGQSTQQSKPLMPVVNPKLAENSNSSTKPSNMAGLPKSPKVPKEIPDLIKLNEVSDSNYVKTEMATDKSDQTSKMIEEVSKTKPELLNDEKIKMAQNERAIAESGKAQEPNKARQIDAITIKETTETKSPTSTSKKVELSQKAGIVEGEPEKTTQSAKPEMPLTPKRKPGRPRKDGK